MSVGLLILAAAIFADPSPAKPFHEYQREIATLLKQESQAKNEALRAAVVNAICSLHREIVQDSRFATSDVLREYRGRLWSRLTKVKAELKQQLARRGERTLDVDALECAATESLGLSLALLDQSQGGPGQLLARGGGAVATDWGPNLVDLIERTINPAFWDVAGGPGTIVYYRPLQCLVVRATTEVHEQIGGVVGDLRKP